MAWTTATLANRTVGAKKAAATRRRNEKANAKKRVECFLARYIMELSRCIERVNLTKMALMELEIVSAARGGKVQGLKAKRQELIDAQEDQGRVENEVAYYTDHYQDILKKCLAS